MQVRRTVEVGAVQLAIKVVTDADLIARGTKNRVLEGIVGRLLNLTIQPLWINMRREYFRDDPS
jgi:DNA-binding GntR family transcriptional regulator